MHLIKDKVVIVTGASAGIGKALAFGLAREGARLMLVSRRVALLAEVSEEANRLGADSKFLVLDLRQEDDVRHMIWRTHKEFGRIDVLVNNAAYGYFGTVEKLPVETLDDIFQVNFKAAVIAMQEAIPIMRNQKSGHIINVSSVIGKRALPLSGAYCATKFALDGISESLRLEVREDGIFVSLVFPQGTRTEFVQNMVHADVPRAFTPRGAQMSAEAVAGSIIACIRRPRAEVYPHWSSRVLAWASVLSPELVDRVISRWHARWLRDPGPAAGPR